MNYQKHTNKRISITDALGVLYTPGEVAKYFKVSPSTVYNWAKTGKIECHVLSQGKRKSTIRFDIEQIQRLSQSENEV